LLEREIHIVGGLTQLLGALLIVHRRWVLLYVCFELMLHE
jgi:hypothetical protein